MNLHLYSLSLLTCPYLSSYVSIWKLNLSTHLSTNLRLMIAAVA